MLSPHSHWKNHAMWISQEVTSVLIAFSPIFSHARTNISCISCIIAQIHALFSRISCKPCRIFSNFLHFLSLSCIFSNLLAIFLAMGAHHPFSMSKSVQPPFLLAIGVHYPYLVSLSAQPPHSLWHWGLTFHIWCHWVLSPHSHWQWGLTTHI